MVTDECGFPAETRERPMLKRRKSTVEKFSCPLKACMSLLGGTWTPNVLWYLKRNPRRFSELKSDIEGISSKLLSARLKRLIKDGLVTRTVVPSSPPSVEYGLTELGCELMPAIEAINSVGTKLQSRGILG